MRNAKPPYMFVTFRKHVETNDIYAIFNQTYNTETNIVEGFSFSDNCHINAEELFLKQDTIKATYHDRESVIDRLKEIYETPCDKGLSAIIKPVPYLPFAT